MYYAPHRLYIVYHSSLIENEHGDPLPNTGTASISFLCDCFLHDAGTHIKNGYAGLAISVKYYVNMDRRDDLETGQEVKVYEADGATIRGKGKIVDIKTTNGMQYGGVGNYTTIYL